MPTATDLVTDLPADFETFGQAVATSMADLLGGTTGQILSKASNTDMDFTWVTNDVGDITAVTASAPLTGGGTSGAITVGIQDGTTAQKGAVQLENSTSSTSTTTAAVPASVKSAYDLANGAIAKTIVDAKGDLIAATAADTVSRLAIGANNTVLTADSAEATGMKWATPASGGGMTLISTTTLSGASVTLSSIPQTYNQLFMVFNRLTNSTADGKFYLNPNAAGTNARASGVENGTAFSFGYGALFQTQNNWDRANADNGMSLRIDNYTAASNYNKAFVWSGYYFNANPYAFITGGILSESSGALTSIVLSNTGGNWAGGTVLLYGVK